jgi:hypothetical protein
MSRITTNHVLVTEHFFEKYHFLQQKTIEATYTPSVIMECLMNVNNSVEIPTRRLKVLDP